MELVRREMTAREMLAELDMEVTEDRRIAILDDIGAAADPLIALLGTVHGPSRTRGELTLAICHMLARGITDLLAGVHLARHCYLAQSYAVMRPVYEAIDLLDLFAADQEQAVVWANTDKAFRHFTPSEVRKKLGRPSFDPMHNHFTEHGSHPRFAAAKLSGAVLRKSGSEDPPDLHMAIGPFLPDRPASLHPYAHALVALGALSFRARHLELATASITWSSWLDAHIVVSTRIVEALRTVEVELCRLTAQPVQTLLADSHAPTLPLLEAWRASGRPPSPGEVAAVEPPVPAEELG